MQILCSRGAKIMLNMRIYANYALCSDSAIMPKSNAGIIGLAQFEIAFLGNSKLHTIICKERDLGRNAI